MSTVRRGPVAADNFTIVSNAIIRDARLSLKARGLGVWLLSHSHGWKLSIRSIATQVGAGAEAVQSGLKELEDAGYLVRDQQTGEHGKFAGVEYRITDVPAGQTASGFPVHGSPADGEPDDRETDTHKKTNSEEDQVEEPPAADASGAPKPVLYSEAFEAAWKQYGRKGAKRAAWAEWQRAIQRASVEVITAGIAPYLDSKPDRTYRKDFERWLKGDVWESAEAQPAGSKQFEDTSMSFQEADAWLHARFTEGAAEVVGARCRRPYRASTPPPSLQGQALREYQFADAQNWIRTNRQGLRAVLMGRPFTNGTEVQS